MRKLVEDSTKGGNNPRVAKCGSGLAEGVTGFENKKGWCYKAYKVIQTGNKQPQKKKIEIKQKQKKKENKGWFRKIIGAPKGTQGIIKFIIFNILDNKLNVGPASSQIVGTTWRQGINYIKLNKKSKPVPYSNNGKPKIQKAPKNKIESNKQIGISKNIINNPNNQSKNRQQSSNPNNNRNANTRSNSSNDKNRREAPHSSEIYEIKSALSGMCLDIRGNSKRNGANIIQWPCNHKNNQRFEI